MFSKGLFGTEIGKSLIIYILLFSGTVTLILTSIQVYLDYVEERSAIMHKFELINDINLQTIESTLWQLNALSLQLQLDGISQLQDVVFAEVADVDGSVLASSGKRVGNDREEKVYPLHYDFQGITQEIGNLTVQVSLKGMYQRLKNTVIILLISQGVKTLVVSFFILFIFQYLVTRHLFTIVDFAQHFELGRLLTPFQIILNRPVKKTPDELDQLVNSLEVMRAHLNDSFQTLNENKELLAKAHTIAKLASFEWDRDSDQIISNDSMKYLFNVDSDRYQCSTIQDYLSRVFEEDRGKVLAIKDNIHDFQDVIKLEYSIHCLDGSMKRVVHQAELYQKPQKLTPVILSTVLDVTDVHRQKEKREYEVMHDPVTGLPNRLMMSRAITDAIEHGKHAFSLIQFELRHFRGINGAVGYNNGDRLLQQVAHRVQGILQPNDLLARVASNEFIVLLIGGVDRKDVEVFVEELVAIIAVPIPISGISVQLEIISGVSRYPNSGDSAESLLRNADIALMASSDKATDLTYYSELIDIHNPRRIQIMSDLHSAISDNQFTLYYQPKISSLDQSLSGIEALIRWNHPELGIIPPDDFLHLAELGNMIQKITLWVIQQAVSDISKLLRLDNDISVSINISAKNMLTSECNALILSLLSSLDVAPKNFCVEMTENSIMSDPDTILRHLGQLQSSGLHVSIDDYGTGYSSLAYLRLLRANELKIDRSFVMEMEENVENRLIIQSTIDLAHDLGLTVVAEGVETKPQMDYLTDFGCDYLQGYYIAKPMPYDDLLIWIGDRKNKSVG